MIILGGYWNAQKNSWFRIADILNECIYIYVNLIDNNEISTNGNIENQKTKKHNQAHTEKKFSEIYPGKYITCKPFIKSVIEKEIYSFNSEVINFEKKMIDESRKFHHNNYINNVGNISAHFFHENFHIYDLPIFSGVSFTILLSILSFSYRRELRNIRKFFQISDELGILHKGYNILAMHQVLTVTPSLIESKTDATDKIANAIPKLLFITPLILEFFIMRNSFDSYEQIIIFSHYATIINISFGLLLSGLVLVLSIICLIISLQIDKIWSLNAEKIRVEMKKKPEVNINE